MGNENKKQKIFIKRKKERNGKKKRGLKVKETNGLENETWRPEKYWMKKKTWQNWMKAKKRKTYYMQIKMKNLKINEFKKWKLKNQKYNKKNSFLCFCTLFLFS